MSKKSQKLFASLTATSLVAAGVVVPVAAEEAPKLTVEVKNNVTLADEIIVKNVAAGATVKVYKENSTADTALLLTKKQGSSAGDVKLAFKKPAGLPEVAEGAKGKVYVTVTPKDGSETTPQEVEYAAEALTTTSNVSVTAVNNVTKKDQIVLVTTKSTSADAATAGAEVKVYSDSKLENEIAKGKIAAFKTDNKSTTTLNLKGKFAAVATSDSVYVVITNKNYLASEAIKETVDAEDFTTLPEDKNVKLNNNVTKKDSLTVTGLDVSKKTVVTVYKEDPATLDTAAKKKAATIGTGKPKADSKDKGSTPGTAEIVIKEKKGFEGLSKVWLTVKNDNENESEAMELDVTSEDTTKFEFTTSTADTTTVTSTADTSKINLTAENNVTKKDTIKILGAPVNAEIFIYESATADTADAKAAVAKAKVKKPKNNGTVTETVINMPKKGFSSDTEELTYYIAIKANNKLISELKEFTVEPTPTTEVGDVNVIVENNVTLKDKVTITGAQAKAKVNIYNVDPETLVGKDKKTVSAAIIGKGTIKAVKDSTTSTDTAITISKGLPEDVIYVEITNPNERPTVMEVEVTPEEYSTLSTGATVTVINNAKAKEQVKLTNLSDKDIVKVFVLKDGKLDEKTGLLGKATAKAGKETTISLKTKFTDDNLETIYVTVQNTNKRPVFLKVNGAVVSGTAAAVTTSETSADTGIVAPKTVQTSTPATADVTVEATTAKNTAKITVKTQNAGDVVTLYDGSTKVKTAKASSSKVATISLTGISADKTYQLTVTGKELLESEKVNVTVKKYVDPSTTTSGDTGTTTQASASINFTSTFATVDFGSKLTKGSVAVNATLPKLVAVNRFAVAPVATTVFA